MPMFLYIILKQEKGFALGLNQPSRKNVRKIVLLYEKYIKRKM
jgi:hypothetical protein